MTRDAVERVLVESGGSPLHAWRLLSEGGLAPAIAHGTRRTFRRVSRCSACDDGRDRPDPFGGDARECSACSGTGGLATIEDHPLALADCRFFARHAADIARAEQLARAAMARLAAWDARPIERWAEPPFERDLRDVTIVWSRVDRPAAQPVVPRLCDAVDLALRAVLPINERGERLQPSSSAAVAARPPQGHIGRVSNMCRAFEQAVRAKLVVPASLELPAAGRPFAELENPYLPLRTICGLGFAVREIVRGLSIHLDAESQDVEGEVLVIPFGD